MNGREGGGCYAVQSVYSHATTTSTDNTKKRKGVHMVSSSDYVEWKWSLGGA